MKAHDYIFTSERLGFRNWLNDDLAAFTELNADVDVMQHFPSPLTTAETADFIDRLQQHYSTYGHNYFAVELLSTGEFIGFIGLAYQTYATDFTPATDIGWRLKKSAWGNGYATEGAKRCLEFAFNTLQLDSIVSTCTKNNAASERVMQKIGMAKMGYFKHPRLSDHPNFETCVWYQLTKDNYK